MHQQLNKANLNRAALALFIMGLISAEFSSLHMEVWELASRIPLVRHFDIVFSFLVGAGQITVFTATFVFFLLLPGHGVVMRFVRPRWFGMYLLSAFIVSLAFLSIVLLFAYPLHLGYWALFGIVAVAGYISLLIGKCVDGEALKVEPPIFWAVIFLLIIGHYLFNIYQPAENDVFFHLANIREHIFSDQLGLRNSLLGPAAGEYYLAYAGNYWYTILGMVARFSGTGVVDAFMYAVALLGVLVSLGFMYAVNIMAGDDEYCGQLPAALFLLVAFNIVSLWLYQRYLPLAGDLPRFFIGVSFFAYVHARVKVDRSSMMLFFSLLLALPLLHNQYLVYMFVMLLPIMVYELFGGHRDLTQKDKVIFIGGFVLCSVILLAYLIPAMHDQTATLQDYSWDLKYLKKYQGYAQGWSMYSEHLFARNLYRGFIERWELWVALIAACWMMVKFDRHSIGAAAGRYYLVFIAGMLLLVFNPLVAPLLCKVFTTGLVNRIPECSYTALAIMFLIAVSSRPLSDYLSGDDNMRRLEYAAVAVAFLLIPIRLDGAISSGDVPMHLWKHSPMVRFMNHLPQRSVVAADSWNLGYTILPQTKHYLVFSLGTVERQGIGDPWMPVRRADNDAMVTPDTDPLLRQELFSMYHVDYLLHAKQAADLPYLYVRFPFTPNWEKEKTFSWLTTVYEDEHYILLKVVRPEITQVWEIPPGQSLEIVVRPPIEKLKYISVIAANGGAQRSSLRAVLERYEGGAKTDTVLSAGLPRTVTEGANDCFSKIELPVEHSPLEPGARYLLRVVNASLQEPLIIRMDSTPVISGALIFQGIEITP